MSETLTVNSNLGHYRIVSKLGAGGMGEVWLSETTASTARLRSKSCQLVLPKMPLDSCAASALNHPNIVTIHEIGESEVGCFI